jgi:uncharacterized protein (TIGR02453 family)
MSVRHPIDEVEYPPFAGFPEAGLDFLKKLKRNNNRPWFQKHKIDYDELVHFPMECLIAELRDRMHDVAPEIDFNPKRSIFRIYRDVRFSKNKAPYKTNIAASFELGGKNSPTQWPGVYVGVEVGEIFVGGGLYMPTGPQIKSIRRSIADRPDEYLAVIEAPRFKKTFGSVLGEKLQKAPLGFPKDHPMIEHLRFKQYYVGIEPKVEACLDAKFADLVAGVFTDAMPFIRWLASAV